MMKKIREKDLLKGTIKAARWRILVIKGWWTTKWGSDFVLYMPPSNITTSSKMCRLSKQEIETDVYENGKLDPTK